MVPLHILYKASVFPRQPAFHAAAKHIGIFNEWCQTL